MKLILMQTGKTTDDNISDIASMYVARIKRYNAFDVITMPELRNTKSMPVEEQKAREGIKMLENISQEDYVVLLDEQGKEMRTREFASLLGKMFMMQKKRILFVIGGPWGFSGDVYLRADERISLSRMTFPHQLVRLLFLEQLYRAFTIIRGEPYHHE